MRGFTIKFTGRVRAIITDVKVYSPFDLSTLAGNPEPPHIIFKAIWDTGATNTVITRNVADSLGLKPTGMVQVETVGGSKIANTYLVNIKLPNEMGFAGLAVTEGEVAGCDVLIGMDLIAAGDFAITNKNGQTWMTFQTPSVHRFDFVDDLKKKDAKPKHTPTRRNAPCPCGSGKKYKHCHGG